MISKELLSEVLSKPVTSSGKIYGNTLKNYQVYDGNKRWHEDINIHELANKCKEWVSKEGYQIQITEGYNMCCIYIGKHGMGFDLQFWRFNTPIVKPEHIFKACQWIRENKNENH